MKGNKSRMWLAALLTICMVFGMAGTAFAGTGVPETLPEYDDAKNATLELAGEVMELLNSYGTMFEGCFENITDEDLQAAIEVLKAYLETMCPTLEDAAKEAEAQFEAIKPELQNAYELLMAEAEALEGVLADLAEEKAALEAELAPVLAELAELNAQLETAAEDAKAGIEAAIEATGAVAEELIAAIAEIDGVIEAVEAADAKVVAKANEVAEALAALESAVEDVCAPVAALNDDVADLAAAAADLAAVLADGFDPEADADVEAAYNAVKAAYEALYGEVEQLELDAAAIAAAAEAADEVVAKAYEAVASVPGIVDEAVLDIVGAIDAHVREQIEAIDAQVREALAALDAYMIEAANEAWNLLVETLKAIDAEIAAQIQAVIDAFEAAYIGAVTGEFAIDCDSKIVSIGDETAVIADAASYGELLAAELSTMNGLDATIDHTQLGRPGLMAEDLLAVVKANAETIADADMVTVSLDNNDFIINNVFAALNGQEVALDWAKYVTEEGVPYVEAVMAEVEAYLAEAGLGEVDLMGSTVDMKALASVAVESAVYAYVDYAWNYAQVLNAVHAINPEAQVVVVGMFNPLKDVVVADVEIGAVIDEVIAVADMYGLIYAMIVPNTTFVAVPEVETVFNATVEDYAEHGALAEIYYYMDLVDALSKGDLVASAAGHEYIKEQIMAAFTVCAGQHVPGEWVEVSFVNGILKEALHCVVCRVQIDERTTDLNTPPVIGGGFFVPQKPVIEASEGVKAELNADGTKVTFTVEEGYILMDVLKNGESLGTDITEVTGLKTGDTVKIVAMSEADFAAMVKDTQLVARSKMSKAKGDDAVKVWWFEKSGSDLDFDGYQVYRSVKRYSGFGKKPIFTTAREAYWNTDIKEGVKYFYKVRGFVEVEGKKYYTDWSLKAWRTVEL